MSNPFRPTYRTLNEAEVELVEQIKDGALALSLLIDQAHGGPDYGRTKGRYTSLAQTALEESVMWATKAVST